jgi:hypothetical protein
VLRPDCAGSYAAAGQKSEACESLHQGCNGGLMSFTAKLLRLAARCGAGGTGTVASPTEECCGRYAAFLLPSGEKGRSVQVATAPRRAKTATRGPAYSHPTLVRPFLWIWSAVSSCIHRPRRCVRDT